MDITRYSAIRRQPTADKRRPGLVRSADGRLRSAAEQDEIGDVWAQQDRIRLAEAIKESKKKAELQRLKRERGLIGVTKKLIAEQMAKCKTLLFGDRSVPAQPKTAQSVTLPATAKAAKTFEVNIALPSFSLSWLKDLLARIIRQSTLLFKFAQSNFLKLSFRARATAIGTVGLGIILLIVTQATTSNIAGVGGAESSSASGTKIAATAKNPAGLPKGTPNYSTILPSGKSIADLGGWTRVSPENKNPVFAYVDKIGSTEISVSQQPLPANFAKDTTNQINQLAQNFNANEKVTVGDTVAHIGASAKGTQSVIFSKDNLLILIKSTAPISSTQWATYISSLK